MAHDDARSDDPLLLISDLCGSEIAEAISFRLGGTRVYLPKTFTPDNPLCAVIGSERYVILRPYLGMSTWYVSKRMMRAAQRAEIMRLSEEGMTVVEIAGKVGLAERSVYVFRAKERARRSRELRP